MRKRIWLGALAALLLGAAFWGAGYLLRPSSVKEEFLPTASNDFLVTVIGGDSSQTQTPQSEGQTSSPERETNAPSVTAYPKEKSYPIGAQTIELTITNHSEAALLYGGYYDFRRLENETWLPLSIRPDVVFEQQELVLDAGETATQTVAIDLFDAPLSEGVYRIAQLACFQETGGEAFACTEISAEFIITPAV